MESWRKIIDCDVASNVLKSATEQVRTSAVRYPGEGAEYRRARETLLAEEVELRCHIERVAGLRRSPPPGY